MKKLLKYMTVGAVVLSLAILAGAACGDDDDDDDDGGDGAVATVGDLEITGASARGALDNGAVYFTVTNSGSDDDALVGAATDVAGKVELHETVDQGGGTMMMRPVEQIDVPAGGEAVLEKGGLHVMLLDLPEPLEMGTTFPIELTFEKAGTVEFEVTVESYSEATMAPEGEGM